MNNTIQNKNIITSESVGIGHPDKMCDYIADSILDEIIESDPTAKVAVEVFASNRLIVIGGEVSADVEIDYKYETELALKKLGYDENTFTILINVNKQSKDISQAVDKHDGVCAGDQGIVYGYATNECPNYLHFSQNLSNMILQNLQRRIRDKKDKGLLRYDMKSQVSVEYLPNGKLRLDTVLVSIQHSEKATDADITFMVHEDIEKAVWSLELDLGYKLNRNFNRIVNPSGKFTIGGPIGDTGLTGRKIIVDTYGGIAKHGGGSFSGKDATKVDRTGAYLARYIAKNIVAAKLADKCEIQLAYAIGKPHPLAIHIDTFNTGIVSTQRLTNAVIEVFNDYFNLETLIELFDMKKYDMTFHYKELSVYGHFGKEHLPWEQLDKVDVLKLTLIKDTEKDE